MSFSDRLNAKIENAISSSVALTNSTNGVIQTTLNGYRGLHLNQIYRFGYGSKTSQSSGTRIDDIFEQGGDFHASR